MGAAASALTGSKPAQAQTTTATATAPRINYNSKMAAMEQGLGPSSSPRRNNTARKTNGQAGNMERGQAPHYGYPMSGTTTPQNPSYGGRRKRSKKAKRSRKNRRSRKN